MHVFPNVARLALYARGMPARAYTLRAGDSIVGSRGNALIAARVSLLARIGDNDPNIAGLQRIG